MTKSSFKSPRIMCLDCKDIIYSRYSGEYVLCSCAIESDKKIDKEYQKIKKVIPECTEYQKDMKWEMETELGHFVRCMLAERIGTGVFIDATEHYTRYGGAGRFAWVPEEDKDDS